MTEQLAVDAKKQDKPQKAKEVKEQKTICTEELQKTIEQQKLQITDLINTAQRLQAEFENYKKRADKEKVELHKTASKEIITKLLPVLDSFQMAIKNKNNVQDFIKGMELIYAQLYDILGREGVRPIEALHKKFDPYKHEVLMQEHRKDVKEDDMITEEFQKGYMLHEYVLRHSKVKIAKKEEQKKDDRPSAGHA